ncbi:MAG TPA: hypothetical protein VKD45_01030 [Hyphomicrobiaceae bacterium]|nr:hypothetical protein [Hyphomicrobiaceae bacterium]
MKLVLGTAMGCSGRRFGPGLAFLLALAAGSAEGQEFCVACSDPPGIYRCVIDGAQPRGGQSLQMLCVTAMAKEGGHATCSVKRGTVFDCDGAVKRIPWTALEPLSQPEVPTSREAPAAPATPAAAAAAPAAPAPDAPPQTMVDLAKQANEKTVEQMKKAGESVKQATKKTWECVVSLFTRC